MTPSQFRRLALSLPESIEGAHMGHPDFRVKGRIFASLYWPKGSSRQYAMVKLTPAQQRVFIQDDPDVFEPCSGAWGRGGATQVELRRIEMATARRAVLAAWRNTAPPRSVEGFDLPAKSVSRSSKSKRRGRAS